MRRKPNLEARMEKNAFLLIPDPEAYRGRWQSEFGFSSIHLELGCGKGRFTIEAAKQAPDILHIGLEKTTNVLILALEHANREGLKNIRFINSMADYLALFFSPSEANRIYLNFSDPWPGRKQAKRRLTSKVFLESYSQVLAHGGEVHLKTDNLPFFEFSLLEFERCGFNLLEETRDLHKNGAVGIMTDYELKFFSQGQPIYRCVAVASGDRMPPLHETEEDFGNY